MLRVPYYKQEKHTTCGLAALRMVLGFNGTFISEKEIVKHVKIHSFGSLSTDLGAFALNLGYKSISYTYHLELFAKNNIPFNTLITAEVLERLSVSKTCKLCFDSIKKYVENGGKMYYAPPRIEMLQQHLHAKNPAIVSVNTASLNRFYKKAYDGHYLVIANINKKVVTVLDPDPEDGEKPNRSIYLNEFFPAWCVNATSSTDYLMIIYK